MRKAIFLAVFSQIFVSHLIAQIEPKYLNSIFSQKGGAEIFFYDDKTDAKSTFLQQNELIATLYSDSLKVELADQQGVLFNTNPFDESDDSLSSKLGVKVGDTFVGLGSFGLLRSHFNPSHRNEDADKDPAFMFTIKIYGNSVELGAGVKDLPWEEWKASFLEKYIEQQKH